MPWLDEPNGKYGRWGQVGESLVTFGILGFLIVKVLLDWVIGAPDWILWAALGVTAVFSLAWGFTVVDEDPLQEEPEPEPEEDNLVWIYDRPDGFWGWVRRLIGLSFGIGGLMFIINGLLLTELLHASDTVKFWVGFPVIALAVALEFFDVVEPDDPRASPVRKVRGARGTSA